MTVALYDKLGLNEDILLDLPFREGIGVITQDVAKPHHPVTLHNTPTWETIGSGLGCLTLNGTNEYLRSLAANTADLDFTSGDYSLGGWFYIATGGRDDKTLMSRFLVSNNGWELYHYINEILTLRHHHAAGASLRTGAYSGDWTYDTWHFMGVSRSGGVAIFYRNGVAITTTISAGGLIDPETCNQNLYIGTEPTGINIYKGKKWRPRIWGRALSVEDWMNIYQIEKRWFA